LSSGKALRWQKSLAAEPEDGTTERGSGFLRSWTLRKRLPDEVYHSWMWVQQRVDVGVLNCIASGAEPRDSVFVEAGAEGRTVRVGSQKKAGQLDKENEFVEFLREFALVRAAMERYLEIWDPLFPFSNSGSMLLLQRSRADSDSVLSPPLLCESSPRQSSD